MQENVRYADIFEIDDESQVSTERCNRSCHVIDIEFSDGLERIFIIDHGLFQ